MICPECKVEYLPRVTRCADCDVDLVDSLPQSGRDAIELASDAELRSVWSGGNHDECARICAQLKASDIPFKVDERAKEFLTQIGQQFEIGVMPGDFDRAKQIIAASGLDTSDESTDLSSLELPAEDGDDSASANARGDWDPDDWFPDDATAELVARATEEHADMIETCLRENYIHSRTDVTDDDFRKIFVLTDDEARAKEILREIEEGIPPQ